MCTLTLQETMKMSEYSKSHCLISVKVPKNSIPPGDSSGLHELYENWIASGEDWRKTRIYIKMTDNSGKIDADARDWLCKTELVQKMGEAGAGAMISFLEEHKPDQVRDHPDAPGIKDTECF